jgi:hypothetical protein
MNWLIGKRGIDYKTVASLHIQGNFSNFSWRTQNQAGSVN